MKPYAELLEFNQPNLFMKPGFTRIREQFPGLKSNLYGMGNYPQGGHPAGELSDFYEAVYDPERIVEFAGAWDYGENNALKLGSRKDNILHRWIDMGHESMLEMADATFFIECSRVVSHELVRHRIASFQQESQRFVKYDNEFTHELFYEPPQLDGVDGVEYWDDEVSGIDVEQHVYLAALEAYKALRAKGVAPQIARYVLPNAMRTRLVMKTNLREWRHICKLRLDKSAQPEMQELMQQVYDQLVDVFPNVMYNALEGDRGVR